MTKTAEFFDAPLGSLNKAFPAFAKALCRLVFVVFRWKADNFEVVEELRAQGKPFVISANHLSFSDPVFIMLALDFKCRFLARSNFFYHDDGSALSLPGRIFAWMLACLGVIPVKHHSADNVAFRRALRCLRRGENVGIFPEGSRKMKHESTSPDTFAGVGLIASTANAPIVPVALIGPEKIRPEGVVLLRFPKVRMVFCEAVDPADYAQLPKEERFQAIADEVMRRIRAVTGETSAWGEVTAKA